MDKLLKISLAIAVIAGNSTVYSSGVVDPGQMDFVVDWNNSAIVNQESIGQVNSCTRKDLVFDMNHSEGQLYLIGSHYRKADLGARAALAKKMVRVFSFSVNDPDKSIYNQILENYNEFDATMLPPIQNEIVRIVPFHMLTQELKQKVIGRIVKHEGHAVSYRDPDENEWHEVLAGQGA